MKKNELIPNPRRRRYSRWMHLILAAFIGVGVGVETGAAASGPASPTDETKVPHYFGPFPNWANSPLTLPDATVTITDPSGTGSGAKASATVGPNGAVTGITLDNPGSNYTSATVAITSGTGTGATANAVVVASGSVTAINVDAGGAGYTSPQVTLSGGGGGGTLVQVGNTLTSRTYATDYATGPGTLAPVLVVLPSTMPASGRVTAIQYFNQATAGSSPTPSAGNLFHAYVLRATATPNQYSVAWDSGELTVPAAIDPVGEVVQIPVPNIAVTTGDTIAFYGEGIPLDDNGTGADSLIYSAPAAPTGTFTLNGSGFPIYSQTRTYSIAANVIDTSGVTPLTNATASAFGGVDAVTITNGGGNGYTFPTVDFDLPDSPNGVQAKGHAECDGDITCSTAGTITAIVVDQPGSGYSFPPGVVIRDGTIFDPVTHTDPFQAATATATLLVQTITVDTSGSGYTSAPTVTITDPTGSGASATAVVDAGAISSIALTNPGSGYLTAGGIKKFQDGLPLLCDPSAGQCAGIANNLGQYLPLAVPDTTTFTKANGFTDDADYYVIALVQHRECMNSSLPNCDPNTYDPSKPRGTLLREYVQLETPANATWSKHVALTTDLPDGTSTPVLMPDGTQAIGVDDPHYLGPVISAQKDRPVRLVFYNLLPKGSGGDLYIPADTSMMGAGYGPLTNWPAQTDQGTVMDDVRNPECTQTTKSTDTNCMKDNRATVHLHGGTTPWISDGTPHQWITPANENTPWPEGASVAQVPDMVNLSSLGVPDCSAPGDGCLAFYYTNQQSARLLFYHDHAFGTTRLNVYLGEAAGYLISDATEQALVASSTIPGPADQIPLIIQDRTFVPDTAQLAEQDPTWDSTRWGSTGDFWYHHVYMPAQNPGDPSGMSAYGRWMYGPWFWPPADPPHGPIANPYYNMDPATGFTTALATPCNLDDPTTWQYDTDPFCEPPLIPGTPNVSAGMEQFNDTPLVNGTAYPTLTVEPKAYRLRVLNAANDRFFNLSLYVADPNRVADPAIGPTEVAFNQAELAAAQLDPNIFPTPDTNVSPPGPDWIVIGNEGGFLPAPVVVPPQPTTWIIDPTRFDVGNVDKHSLLVAPAERADVIVDFSQYAGQTLILYNDAPAAFPARVSTYDYYTGAPDQYPVGAPTLPGYGPNTRTVMQIKVAGTPAQAFNLTKLKNAFNHKANGSGVFESGQHPIIVGQSSYNSAYGTGFASSSYCNGGSTSNVCDGMLRIADQGGTLFGFNTLLKPTSKMSIKIEPKAIHDEMNAAAFDEFGRMTANIGLEVVPANPAAQNIVLYPYINPPTEIIDATKLPHNQPGVKMTPISVADDGTQIWKITHNGVDTHPLHFHLYDVQLLNRVTWDNIIIPPDATELGWKDTVRTSPLEDTIVALRPLIPSLPFELPNSVRLMNPAMPDGTTMGFNNIDANGVGTSPILNSLVNFGWEYVWHCHILSHEEMDMMRPQVVAVPPIAPAMISAVTIEGSSTVDLAWNDNSITETAFLIQADDGAGGWKTLKTIFSPLDQPNVHEVRNETVPVDGSTQYRVVAQNTVGYGGEFMSVTVQSESAPTTLLVQPPPAPIAGIVPASLAFGSQTLNTTSAPRTVTLSNTGNAPLTFTPTVTGDFAQSNTCNGTVAASGTCQIDVTFTPTSVGALTGTLSLATNDTANPTLSVSLSGTGVALAPIAGISSASLAFGSQTLNTTSAAQTVTLSNTGNAPLTFTPTVTGDFAQSNTCNGTVAAAGTCQIDVTFTPTSVGALTGSLSLATNDTANPTLSVSLSGTGVALAVLAAPSNLVATYQTNGGGRVRLVFRDNAPNSYSETGFVVERSENGGAFTSLTTLGQRNNVGNVRYFDTTIQAGITYSYRVAAVNSIRVEQSAWSNTVTVATPGAPAAPGNVAVSCTRNTPTSGNARCTVTWADNSSNETGFRIQRADNAGFTAPVLQTVTRGANTVSWTTGNISRNTSWYFRVQSYNGTGTSAYVNATPFPSLAPIN